MSARTWLLLTLLATVGVGGAVVAVNARLDIYGLFRDTHGRRLPIYDSERRGKYLLSQRYVPQNFDAILLGSSLTSNWNTGGITSFRTYNESTDGGNISEEKLLAEAVLRAPGGLKMAVCIVHPYLTDSQGLNADEMKASEYWGALGSTSLLQTYKRLWAVHRDRSDLVWDELGTEDKGGSDPTELKPLNPVLRRIMTTDGELHVDEAAFSEYRALIGELRQRGVKLVAVVPPTIEELLGPRRARMDRYVQRALALFSPGDLVIDFDGPEYASFRADRANYRDGVHLTRRGAATVVKLLDQRLLAWRDAPAPPR